MAHTRKLSVHNGLKTTERYTHVSQMDLKRFRNPMDEIMEELIKSVHTPLVLRYMCNFKS